MPAFKETCRRLWIELTAHRAHPPPPPALHYVPVARLAIPRAAFSPLRTPERPEWAAGWDFQPSPFRRDFTPYMELERLPRSATPHPQGVRAIMQQSVPVNSAITPVRLLRALTPEPALLDILRQPRTPADNSPSASEGSPSPPTDRTRDPDWRLAGQAHFTPTLKGHYFIVRL
jgi:hypothetical protein